MGIPIAVQNLIKDQEVFQDASVALRDAFQGSEEAALTVLRRPYSVREREELFTRLVRSTVLGDLGQLRELLKELLWRASRTHV